MSNSQTGGECAYEALVKLGVKHVFGIPSVHNLPIFDAILRGGEIEPIIVRNEQCAAHSADGYARASGRLGVVLASTGPGTTNTVTGLYEAGFASSPIMVVTGQVDSIYYGKSRGAGHEAENQFPMLQTVARRVESPRYTHDIAPALYRVAQDVMSGRPQPGAVEIPIDLQYGRTDQPVGEPLAPIPVTAQSDAVARAQAALADSTRRVILAGGGVIASNASAALTRLAEQLNAPVLTTTNGKGAIAANHPLSLGAMADSQAIWDAWQDADVVFAVGTRFRGNPRIWNLDLPGKFIHLDADPDVLGRVHEADVAVVGDARLGLEAISSGLNAKPGDEAFVGRLKAASASVTQDLRERIGPDHAHIMDTLRDQMPDDAILVRDMTIAAYAWANNHFPIIEPRTTMNPTSGAIGPGLPLANGAAVATGKKTIIIQGDGGFMMHIGELSVAVQYELPIVVCVFTDGGYGVLRGIQGQNFDGRTVGVELATPDFVKIAEGMGMQAEKVPDAGAFGPALDRALQARGPVLLDIDAAALQPIKGFGKPRAVTRAGG